MYLIYNCLICCANASGQRSHALVFTVDYGNYATFWRHRSSGSNKIHSCIKHSCGIWKFWTSVNDKSTHTHTYQSRAAVLDIFNKLKPRYKKMYISFPPLLFLLLLFLINCDKHSFSCPPQNESTIQSKNQCWISNSSHLNTDWKAEQLHLRGRLLSARSHLSAAAHVRNICPQEPERPHENTYMLHVCRHLG